MAASLSLAFTPSPLATGEKLVIEASAPVSAGKTGVPRGRYRVITVTAAAPTSPANILTAYQTVYGALVGQTGMKIFLRARIINPSGFAGAPIYTSVVLS